MNNWLNAVMDPLKSANETVKGLIEIRDTAKFGNAIIELQAQIMTAQQGAFAAQARESALAEEVRDLKARMAELEAWDAEQEKYELTEVPPGVFVFALKESEQSSEPAHWICANCFQHHQKSLLQRSGVRSRRRIYHCANCSNEIEVEGEGPDAPRPRVLHRRPSS